MNADKVVDALREMIAVMDGQLDPDVVDDLCPNARKTLAEHDAQPAQAAQPVGVPEYSEEMGIAAEKYHASFKYAHPLPARWSWCDLWQAMLAAAPQPPAQPSADTEDALCGEVLKLRAFAQDIMRAWPEGDVDGGELQEAALRHGLLEPAEPTQEERDEWGLDDGDPWYRKTALLSPNDGGNPRERSAAK